MKLKKVILENFRSYKERVSIDINDLTAFIGKNDIGKSTVLEALEIFFNNSLVKIEQDDLCVHSTSDKVTIGCIFTDIPDKSVIDASAGTSLEKEFLLNEEKQLEIHKVYDCSKKTVPCEVFLIANYPSNEKVVDLHDLTQAKLKKRIKDLGISEETIGDLRSNVSLRQAIYQSCTDLQLQVREVPTKGEVKSIWEKINSQLPLYSLFQSDRPSLDGDSEVQDPMKLAIKEALELVEPELIKIKEAVQKKALEVAGSTVEKLKDMDANLAKQLKPHFSEEPRWDRIFKLSLDGDNDIPINKRGSGVRRLILLNFFRAEAERKITEHSNRGIIYAIEEPETAQHPNNQILLADAFKTLSEAGNSQVILTTHVPGFAGLLPTNSLRYIKETSIGKEVMNASLQEETVQEIAEALGVLPPIHDSVKVLVFVEGIHDISALKTLSKIIHGYDSTILNLETDRRVVMVPLGGSTLKGWVEHQYLKTFNLPEVHVYDSDNLNPPKYQTECDKVNTRLDGSKAFSTKKREMENYISHRAIKEVLGIEIAFTSQCNVPNRVAKLIHENSSDTDKPWEEVNEKKQKQKESNAKKRLNNEVIQVMTYEQLCEVDTEKEVEEWLRTISRLCLEAVPN
ncbi:ATP-binding protein [Priestia megaterium]|uniref:ATP-binding protein n=1 Tax=Priestia megaterium TaxID=1404 RepID=UPI003CC5EF29